ncbi:MAG: 3-isopropylmalate dehydratase small subunit [Pseudomonadota bacterium]
MTPFTTLEAVAVPLPQSDINTDQILPGRFLRKQRAEGFGQYFFHDLRFSEDGSELPGFILNRPAYRRAQITVSGANFGCGSSREMAVWAVGDYGVRALVAPSFGDIFRANCIRNALLPVVLPAGVVQGLLDQLAQAPGSTIAVDLPQQTVTGADGRPHGFDIDPFHKKCLVQGIDGLDYTLRLADRITAYESRSRDEALAQR